MADIRCPSCGKQNPAGSETCFYCKSVLPPSTPSRNDTPDWLNNLRGDAPDDSSPWSSESPKETKKPVFPDKPQESAASSEAPDWLARIREKSKEESGPKSSGDDWLRQLGGDSSSEESDTPDWMKEEEPGEQAAAPQGGAPDWMNNLGGSGADDWLGQLRANDASQDASPQFPGLSESSSGPAAPAGENTDWMANLPSWQSEPEKGSPPAASEKEDDQDWMANLQSWGSSEPRAGSESAPAAQEPDQSSDQDWMANLQSWGAPADSDPAVTPAEPAQSSDQDWMANLQSWDSAPVDSSPAITPAEPAQNSDQDWMAGFGGWPGVTEEAPKVEQPEPPAKSADAIPGWLNALGVETPAESSPTEPTGGTFDWLNMPTDEPETKPTAETSGPSIPPWVSQLPDQSGESGAVPAFSGSMPDWLNDLPTNDTGNASTPADGSPFTFESQEPEEAAPAAFPAGGLWADEPVDAVPFTSADESTPAAQPGEVPDWLKAFSEELPVEIEAEPIEPVEITGAPIPFAGDELPDWLGQDAEIEPSPAAGQQAPAETAAEGEDMLQGSQLPGWLEAMRPVEAVMPEESVVAPVEENAPAERSGPLAGLVGALPGEALVVQVRKPPAYSSKLQVSERQRQNAALIEEMLSEESQAQAVRPERSHVPERAVRVLVTILLLLALLVPMVGNINMMPQPDLFPPHTTAFHSLIEKLPEGAPVLLAVDYEPGLSGELNLAAGPLIDHLALRKARVAVVSTVPAGPILAEGLLQNARSQRNLQVANLGFLPGGTTGLQAMGLRLRDSLPYLIEGRSAWTEENSLFKDVDSLAKFAVVIVLTDSAENARAWIEQVRPALGSTPMLFVSSAQSAPMIMPYIDSRQVQGMVSGMSGGAMYARLTQQPGLQQSAYWDSYQFGLMAAVFLILLGGIIQLFATVVQRPAKRRA